MCKSEPYGRNVSTGGRSIWLLALPPSSRLTRPIAAASTCPVTLREGRDAQMYWDVTGFAQTGWHYLGWLGRLR